MNTLFCRFWLQSNVRVFSLQGSVNSSGLAWQKVFHVNQRAFGKSRGCVNVEPLSNKQKQVPNLVKTNGKASSKIQHKIK
jgi:hypothetical protein